LSHANADPAARAVLRGTKQHAALEALIGAPGGLSSGTLRSQGVTLATLRRLAAQGLVHIAEERRERDPFAADAAIAVAEDARELTDEQQAAFAALSSLIDQRQFHTALLHGVTG